MTQQRTLNTKEIKKQAQSQSDHVREFAKRLIDGIENEEIREILREDWEEVDSPEKAYERAMKGI